MTKERAPVERVAIYPGSFDPLTNGHVDIVRRAREIFDRLVVTVAVNSHKQPLFSINERLEMLREALGDDPGIEFDSFDGLLVDYARKCQIPVVVRGLRAVSDFEYEFQMASINRKLAPELKTVFMMAGEEYFYISSHLVREVATLGGPVDALVPPIVLQRLRERLEKNICQADAKLNAMSL